MKKLTLLAIFALVVFFFGPAMDISAASDKNVIVLNTPLPVTLEGMEGKEPFKYHYIWRLTAGVDSDYLDLYNFSGEKRLEIEFISIRRTGFTGGVGPKSSVVTFNVSVWGLDGAGLTALSEWMPWFAKGQKVLLHANPNDMVRLNIGRNDWSSQEDFTVTVTGYLYTAQ